METIPIKMKPKIVDIYDLFPPAQMDPDYLKGTSLELNFPVNSMDISKKETLYPVLKATVNLEIGDRVDVPAYACQQVVVSEVSNSFSTKHQIDDVRFPAVRAELLTKRKMHNISWNVGRVRAGRNNLMLAFGAKLLHDMLEEAVVFNVKVRGSWQSYIWEGTSLTRIPLTTPLELRVSDRLRFNYTTSESNEFYTAVPMTHTLFQPQCSYYVYIDGCPYYLPYDHLITVKVVDNKAYSHESRFVCDLIADDGLYLVEDTTFKIIRSTNKRADSIQQITINRNSLITVQTLLTELPYLLGHPSPIPSPWPIHIVEDIDTTLDVMQIVNQDWREMDNRQKIVMACQNRVDFEIVNNAISTVAVIVGNVRYAPFMGLFSNDIGTYLGRFYVRNRTRGDIIVVKNMKPHYVNGTWYAQPDVYDRLLQPPDTYDASEDDSDDNPTTRRDFDVGETSSD